MTVLANLLNGLFDLLVAPFGDHAAWALLVLSLLVGLVMLLLFKAATNPERLVAARRRLTGHVYEMGLYQDHLSVLFRIQRDLALANVRYLWQTLPALAVILLPMVVILVQLDARFAHRPFRPGETALVVAHVDPLHLQLLDQLVLDAPDGIDLESRPVRDRSRQTVTWRVRVNTPGRHELALTSADGGQWTKSLSAGDGLLRLARTRERAGWHHALLNPGESPLPSDSPLAAIDLQLPPRQTAYLGFELHWLVALCLFSLVFGFAIKDLFGVKF